MCYSTEPKFEEEFRLNLEQLGFTPDLAESFDTYRLAGYAVGRVSIQHRDAYRIYTEQGDISATVSGKLRHSALSPSDLPAIGDFVALRHLDERGRAIIHAVLPRKTVFTRKSAGAEPAPQVVAANADTVFIVSALNNDFNLRRMERYLILTWESGARPVMVLTKSDLSVSVQEQQLAVEAMAPGVPVHAVSTVTGLGLEHLRSYVQSGQTVALLGSSGVGKSSLVNALVGETLQKVCETRTGDDRGRHTTTHRSLILVPGGGVVMDTPGMRELQLWDADEGVSQTFADIESLQNQCRFRDCTHNNEPGCAVGAALSDGTLSKERFKNYQKMLRELAYIARKAVSTERTAARARGRAVPRR